jgi:hypothetical protein
VFIQLLLELRNLLQLKRLIAVHRPLELDAPFAA